MGWHSGLPPWIKPSNADTGSRLGHLHLQHILSKCFPKMVNTSEILPQAMPFQDFLFCILTQHLLSWWDQTNRQFSCCFTPDHHILVITSHGGWSFCAPNSWSYHFIFIGLSSPYWFWGIIYDILLGMNFFICLNLFLLLAHLSFTWVFWLQKDSL